MSHTLTRPFFVTTFWMAIIIAVLLIASPAVYILAIRHEKQPVHRILYGVLIAVIDTLLVSMFLNHIHRAGTSLPVLLNFYYEYFKTTPH